MKTILRSVAIVFLILFAITGLVALFDGSAQTVKTLTLSELVTKVNNQEIKDIQVQGNDLVITSSKDERFGVKKESGFLYYMDKKGDVSRSKMVNA